LANLLERCRACYVPRSPAHTAWQLAQAIPGAELRLVGAGHVWSNDVLTNITDASESVRAAT